MLTQPFPAGGPPCGERPWAGKSGGVRQKINAPQLRGTSAQRCDLWGGVASFYRSLPGCQYQNQDFLNAACANVRHGFNLFYGLRARGWRRYYWLDLHRLAESLLRPGQRVDAVRYFTSRLEYYPSDPGKQTRQNTCLEALTTLPDTHIHYGYFQAKPQRCHNCGAVWRAYEEKMTDVNIAVELLGDAHDDAFDSAILVSGDGDLAGPLLALRERYPTKSVVVAFPPKRNSIALINAATAHFTVGRGRFHNSQLPARVTRADGFVLARPPSWA